MMAYKGQQCRTERGERMLMRYLADKAAREGLALPDTPGQDGSEALVPLSARPADDAEEAHVQLSPGEHSRVLNDTYEVASTDDDSIPDIPGAPSIEELAQLPPASSRGEADAADAYAPQLSSGRPPRKQSILKALRDDPDTKALLEQVMSAADDAAAAAPPPERTYGQLREQQRPQQGPTQDEPLSLSPLMRDASRLEGYVAACESAVEGAPAAAAPPPPTDPSFLFAHEEPKAAPTPDELEVLKELTLARQVAEHLKTRVHEQQCEIRTLRDKVRLFGEATAPDGREALIVVLSQLADSERATAALRTAVDEKQKEIEQLKASMGEGQTQQMVAALQEQLQELRSRNAALSAENRVLKEERDNGALGAVAQERLQQLQQANVVLQQKIGQKDKSLKDMGKLLQLHLSLRGGTAETQMRQFMSGAAGGPHTPLRQL